MSKKDLNIAESVTPEVNTNVNVSMGIKEAAKKKLQELVQEESKLVEGIFQCFETPGATVTISVRKYPGIPPFSKSMTDGESYKIPLYVARHLNGVDVSAGALGDPANRNPNIGTCSYPVHGFKWNPAMPAPGCQMGDKGVPVPIVGIAKRVKRYGFQSLEFAAGVT